MTDEARYRAAEAKLWASTGATPTERRVHWHGTMSTCASRSSATELRSCSSTARTRVGSAGRRSRRRWTGTVRDPARPARDGVERSACRRRLDDQRLRAYGDLLVLPLLDALGLRSAHLDRDLVRWRTWTLASARPRTRICVDRHAPVRAGRFGALGGPIPTFMRVMTFPGIGRVLSVATERRSVRMSYPADRPRAERGLPAPSHATLDIETYLAPPARSRTAALRHGSRMGRAFVLT